MKKSHDPADSENPAVEAPEKPPERRVKSVNFLDATLLEFANHRAEHLYGGNFSAYVIALVERDRALGESRRFLHDLEAAIIDLIKPHGGRPATEGEPYDFEIRRLRMVIVARSRFPRERHLEYQLLSSMQKLAITSQETRIVIVHPADLTDPEKERFRLLETAGIEKMWVIDLSQLEEFLTRL
jgi:hypothetical protein